MPLSSKCHYFVVIRARMNSAKAAACTTFVIVSIDLSHHAIRTISGSNPHRKIIFG